jgi:hypothetical protein
MSIVRVKIQNVLLDKRADTLRSVYYNKMTRGYRTLLKDGKILERLPLPKDKSEEDNLKWELLVVDHETTDVLMPLRGRDGEFYAKKRLIKYFEYENDEAILAKMSQNEREKNILWRNFHDFHKQNPDMIVYGADGKNANQNKTGDARWEMHDLSEKTSTDGKKKRLAIKMNNILTDTFDTNRSLFIQMCHGIGLSNEVEMYKSDHDALCNVAMQKMEENPYLLEIILSSENSEYLLNIRQAIGKGIISNTAGSYWIGEDPIGATEDDLVKFFKLNDGKYALISEKKLPKAEPKTEDETGVVSEAVIAEKCKYETQRKAYVKARRNEYREDEEKSAIFEERLANVCQEKGWPIVAASS